MSFLSSLHGDGQVGGWKAVGGDVIGLVAAMLFGLNEVLYKRHFVPTSGPSLVLANLVTMCVGFATVSFHWVFVVVFNAIGWEVFAWPSMAQFKLVAINAVCGLVYNAAFLPVIALNGPVVAAVGVMLSIPSVAMVDWVVLSRPLTLGVIVGSVMVMLSFWMLVSENYEESEHRVDYASVEDSTSILVQDDTSELNYIIEDDL
jgi:drug/metabolite transporter (DMT)-like permease